MDVDVALVSNASANAPSPQAPPVPTRARPMRHRPDVPAAPKAPARFALSAGTVATAPAPAIPQTSATGSDAPAALGEREVDVPARLLASSPLVYPPAAREAGLELDLPLDIVVDTTGRVASARPVSKAGFGLDEAAASALRGYRFSPALRAGRAVPVRMRWTVQFRLR